jgi:hypothetical protein
MSPNNKKRLDGIEERLNQIETLLGPRLPKPRSAFQQFREHLWDQVKRHKGTIIPLAAIFVGVLGWFVSGWFKYYLDHRYDFVNEMISTNLKAKGGVNDKLDQIQQTADSTKTTLQALQPYIHDTVQRQFENVAKLPTATLMQRIPALKDLVAVAKNQNVAIDPNIVTEVGKKLVDASSDNAEAWGAVLRWVDYKSFNNSFSASLPDTTSVAEFRDEYVINIPTGADHPTFSLKGLVPADSAAQTGYIGEDRNAGLTSGPEWIVIEGGAVGLDGISLRNVIFRNVYIQYFGAPLIMKNVYFIGCTFDMKVDPETRHLAIALLAPAPSTTFQSMAKAGAHS